MNDNRLSPDGEQRRYAILSLARDEARRRRSRRLAARGFMAIFPIVVGVGILVRMQPPMPAGRPSSVVTAVRSSPHTLSQPAIAIQYVQTDPTITDRLTLPPVKPRWTAIGDQELLDELAAAGQPAGIVCLNGKTTLLPR